MTVAVISSTAVFIALLFVLRSDKNLSACLLLLASNATKNSFQALALATGGLGMPDSQFWLRFLRAAMRPFWVPIVLDINLENVFPSFSIFLASAPVSNDLVSSSCLKESLIAAIASSRTSIIPKYWFTAFNAEALIFLIFSSSSSSDFARAAICLSKNSSNFCKYASNSSVETPVPPAVPVISLYAFLKTSKLFLAKLMFLLISAIVLASKASVIKKLSFL